MPGAGVAGSPRPILAASACEGWLLTQPQERQAYVFARSWGKARGSRALPMAEWGYLPAGRVSTADPRSREVIRNACKAVGSISTTAFDVRFNPDIFSPGRWWGRVGSQTLGPPSCVLASVSPPAPASFCLAQASAVPLTGVRFPESCQEEVRDQKQLLKDAAAFLLSCQIPGLVREGPQGGGLLQALKPHPSPTPEACGTFT